MLYKYLFKHKLPKIPVRAFEKRLRESIRENGASNILQIFCQKPAYFYNPEQAR
jgi:hypothetical protein